MKIKTLVLAPGASGSRYQQLYASISADILQGRMKKGDQLPSIRSAAKQLNLSRTTIENAYQRLLIEGLIVAIPQRGYFVDAEEAQSELRREIMNSDQTHQYAEEWIDLRSSSIDAAAFDTKIWLHYIKQVLQNESWLTSYGDPQGEYLLRRALQKYSYAMRGVLCKAEQIVVGANFQSLLYLICSLFEGKKTIGMEKSGFIQAEQVFHDCGFTIVYLDHDEEGVCLKDCLRHDLGMLYINSASSGTKKRALHSKRRQQLLNYIQTHDVLLLEDDHNGELRYQSKVRPAMQGFDRSQHMIYMRSFSKLLLPSIRMSFMVLNESLYQRYRKKKQNYHPSASKWEQLALAYYLMDGHMDKQIRQLRKRYEAQSTLMMELLDAHFPAFSYILDEASLQILLFPKCPSKVKDYIQAASDQHIYVQQYGRDALALSFASLSADTLKQALYQLAKAWQKVNEA